MNPSKTILCFGDSNTWGADPERGGRHPFNVRWPGVLRQLLGPDCWVIEEGLGGRTTTWDDPLEGDKNGRKHLPVLLWSHCPIDLVIIMLGTNDLKARFQVPAVDTAEAVGQLVDAVRTSPCGPGWQAPKAMVICPPPILEVGQVGRMFAGGAATSQEFRPAFEAMAQGRNLDLIYAQDHCQSHPADGIHLDATAHQALAQAVHARVKALLA